MLKTKCYVVKKIADSRPFFSYLLGIPKGIKGQYSPETLFDNCDVNKISY